MTKALYYDDAYQTEFNAIVLECSLNNDHYEIVLDQTLFYPEGGGQGADIGYLDDAYIYDVHKKDDEIYHYSKEEVEVGKTVIGKINFDHRFDMMQQHSGEHIFSFLMTSLCGFSSSGTFSFVFIMFALFFVLVDKENNLLKYYSISLFFPTLNILFIKIDTSFIVILLTLLFFLFVYILNNIIIKFFRKKYIKQATIILISIALVLSSALFYTYNYNFVEFFFNNHSEFSDMSWDYFSFYDLRHWIFNLLILIPMFYYIVKYRKNKLSMIIWILILTVFNPLSANLLNGLFVVYYRAYDLIINQFTISYFTSPYVSYFIKFYLIFCFLQIFLNKILTTI